MKVKNDTLFHNIQSIFKTFTLPKTDGIDRNSLLFHDIQSIFRNCSASFNQLQRTKLLEKNVSTYVYALSLFLADRKPTPVNAVGSFLMDRKPAPATYSILQKIQILQSIPISTTANLSILQKIHILLSIPVSTAQPGEYTHRSTDDPSDSDPNDSDPIESDPSDSDPSDSDPNDSDPNDSDPIESDPNDSDSDSDSDPSELTILQKCRILLEQQDNLFLERVDIIEQFNNITNTVHSEAVPIDELLQS
jgi:hypothetical protein